MNTIHHDVPIVITMGDPAGVGVEYVLQLLATKQLPLFYLIAPLHYVEKVNRDLRLKIKLKKLTHPNEIVNLKSSPHTLGIWDDFNTYNTQWVSDCYDSCKALPYHSIYAESIIYSLDTAVEHVQQGFAKSLVTSPIDKSTLLQSPQWSFMGQTEYLGYKFGFGNHLKNPPIMVMWTNTLKVIPLTTHIPIKNVVSKLTSSYILQQTHSALEALHSYDPFKTWNILFTGLNPHAGDQGYMGEEETNYIIPAIKQLKAEVLEKYGKSFHILGPVAGDTAFIPYYRKNCDVIITMYHDQGLAPMKALYFDETVNVTLGLKWLDKVVIRTSPDHGPAFNLTYTGQGSMESTYHAIMLADSLPSSYSK